MKNKYKVINKTRFYSFIIVVVIVLTVSLLFFFDRKEVYSSPYQISYEEFQVAKGDTLWTIAKIYLPKNKDIRKMIYEIKQINNLTSGYIYPGDIIKIPLED